MLTDDSLFAVFKTFEYMMQKEQEEYIVQAAIQATLKVKFGGDPICAVA